MLKPGSRSGSRWSIFLLTISFLLTYVSAANAEVSFTNLKDGDEITSGLPITVTGTQSETATAVFLNIIQDPSSAVPPAGTGGATNQISTTNPSDPIQIKSATTWETTLILLNGKYRLSVFSDKDFPPAEIDITVNIANNPGFLNCVSDLGGVQANVISWDPGTGERPSAPSVNFNFNRSSTATTPELDPSDPEDPVHYPVGTAFTCTQDTGGHTPRILIFGGDPVIDADHGFAGWSVEGSTLTAEVKTVAATLPDGTPLRSMIAGLFAMYDDDPSFPEILPDLTGTYLAANSSFSFGFVFEGSEGAGPAPTQPVGGKITGLSLTLDGPTGAEAFFKAFFPNAVVNKLFGPSCADIPLPEVTPLSAIVSGPTPNPIGSVGCELSVEVKFASPVTVKQSIEAAPSGPLAIGATTLPEGEVGVSYNGDLEISGGNTPYKVEIIGSLPAGLNKNDNGIISGTPTGTGASFTAKVTDDDGTSVTKKFKVAVFKRLTITTKALKAGKKGKKYSAALKVTGGKKPYTWSITSGALPDGLAFDTATGKITGTPTKAGSADVTFEVTDPVGGETEVTLTLTVN